MARVQRFAARERVRKALQAERPHAREGTDYVRSSRQGRAIYHEPSWAAPIVAKAMSGNWIETLSVGPKFTAKRNEFWLCLYEDESGPFYRNAQKIRDYWNRVAPKAKRIRAGRNGSQMVLVGIARARENRAQNRKVSEVRVSTFSA
jgi:hypothetical protein